MSEIADKMRDASNMPSFGRMVPLARAIEIAEAEVARLAEDLAHEKRQRTFVETHITRADCGAFRIGMPSEASTCDPAKPCIRCAQAKEVARLASAMHDLLTRERDAAIADAAEWRDLANKATAKLLGGPSAGADTE